MNPENERKLSKEEQSEELDLKNDSAEVLDTPENIDLKESPDTSELGVVDVDTSPNLPKSETKIGSSEPKTQEEVASGRAVRDKIAQLQLARQMVGFTIGGGPDARGSDIYSDITSGVTEIFWDKDKAGLKRPN